MVNFHQKTKMLSAERTGGRKACKSISREGNGRSKKFSKFQMLAEFRPVGTVAREKNRWLAHSDWAPPASKKKCAGFSEFWRTIFRKFC